MLIREQSQNKAAFVIEKNTIFQVSTQLSLNLLVDDDDVSTASISRIFICADRCVCIFHNSTICIHCFFFLSCFVLFSFTSIDYQSTGVVTNSFPSSTTTAASTITGTASTTTTTASTTTTSETTKSAPPALKKHLTFATLNDTSHDVATTRRAKRRSNLDRRPEVSYFFYLYLNFLYWRVFFRFLFIVCV